LKEGSQAPIGSIAGFIVETKEALETLQEKRWTEAAQEPGSSGDTVKMYEGIKVRSTVPLTGIRKAIAEHMQRSLSISAQVTVMGEIDMKAMMELRRSLVAKEKVLGTRVTYSGLLVVAVAKALGEHPMVNSSIIDNEIKIWEDINIAIAVSIEEGVIAPVIRHADRKSLVEISQELKKLAQKARDRTLLAEEVKGGTFTISNLGAVGAGWRFDTIIVNQPQSAILATGGITDRAVVRDGQIVVRPIMTYMLTYDHRVIEGGGIITRFLNSLTGLLENPVGLV
jgi:pyruvate dehydrogenase E2 component (dihydrolipoamide acetyltransferase)/2-oxoglutarate dehydrogenase E2 component (dihydrolipoamide succinyltransferase)